MTTRMLWRLEGATRETLEDSAKLAEGLALHLAHADLLMVLMQVGTRQQAYLALAGGRGCAAGRCEPGCPRDLLRRLLKACFPSCDLRGVASGLASRLYSRFVAAKPTRGAQPLEIPLLSSWPEARLIVHWRKAGRGVGVGAVLAVGAEGPDPAEALLALGWQPSRVHARAARALALAPIPSAAPASATWMQPVHLLLPGATLALSTPPSPATTQDSPAAPTSPLAVLLDRALAAGKESRTHAKPATALAAGTRAAATTDQAASRTALALSPEEQGTMWPAGPGRMRPALVEALIKRLLSDPAILGAAPPGLTKNRLKPLVEGPLVEPLLVWLDAADVLTEPSKPELRWREPRVLRSADLPWLAERLRGTPLPDAVTVRAVLGGK